MDEIPITVKGDIEPRAVEQLRRCAEAGDAVSGAICADGHVGYSQPIGGVLAYPDHISPSGVGYDIGCIARGTRMTKRRGRIKQGEIDFETVQARLVGGGIELRGGAADEAPAYKRLDAVLAAHGDTIEILHRLEPIGVAMAGADTFDPYKD